MIKFFLGCASIVLLFNLGSIKKNDKLENRVLLEAIFKKDDGVQVGSPVMISGIKVGSVENISLSENYTVSELVDSCLSKNIKNTAKILN